MQKSTCCRAPERMPESTYGHISRVIQNLSLKFKLRHFEPTQNVTFELMGTPSNRNVGEKTTLENTHRNPKSLLRKNPGAAHYPGSRRTVYYSLYPKLICSLFFQESGPKRAQYEKNEPRGRRITACSVCFWNDKNTFSKV